jgi:hypothetical protein
MPISCTQNICAGALNLSVRCICVRTAESTTT